MQKNLTKSTKKDWVDVVMFTGSQCPSCKTLKNKIGKLPYEELNIESKENMLKASKYHVTALPTTILFKDNLPMKSFMGDVGLQPLLDGIDEIKGNN